MSAKLSLPIVAEIRAVKTAREIEYIKKAQKISEQVLAEVLKKLRPDVSEIEIRNFIVRRFKQLGVRALAFPPIVSFGRGTTDVHHEPNSTRLKKGDIVMFDFGCAMPVGRRAVNHYCSDMTRTFFFGANPSAKFKKVYTAVLTAQERVLAALAKGERRAKVLDHIARGFLSKKFGKKSFPHGLGHGVGTAIHEWPSFKPKSSDILRPNMVMTVEPGVYLKGWGGVRIEDMVLVTRDGIFNLTKVPKTPVFIQPKTKIMVFGTFDVLHKGHLNFFKQARQLVSNPYLTVSVARDRNVLRIKKRKPIKGEKARAVNIKKYPLVDKVVLGGIKDHLPHILKEKPDIIALGYDQSEYTANLKKELTGAGLKNTKIIRLKKYYPNLYKSSIITKK